MPGVSNDAPLSHAAWSPDRTDVPAHVGRELGGFTILGVHVNDGPRRRPGRWQHRRVLARSGTDGVVLADDRTTLRSYLIPTTSSRSTRRASPRRGGERREPPADGVPEGTFVEVNGIQLGTEVSGDGRARPCRSTAPASATSTSRPRLPICRSGLQGRRLRQRGYGSHRPPGPALRHGGLGGRPRRADGRARDRRAHVHGSSNGAG